MTRPAAVAALPRLLVVPRSLFARQLTTLSPMRGMAQVCQALRDAVHCTDLAW